MSASRPNRTAAGYATPCNPCVNESSPMCPPPLPPCLSQFFLFLHTCPRGFQSMSHKRASSVYFMGRTIVWLQTGPTWPRKTFPSAFLCLSVLTLATTSVQTTLYTSHPCLVWRQDKHFGDSSQVVGRHGHTSCTFQSRNPQPLHRWHSLLVSSPFFATNKAKDLVFCHINGVGTPPTPNPPPPPPQSYRGPHVHDLSNASLLDVERAAKETDITSGPGPFLQPLLLWQGFTY